ncbi:hypothetical protein HDU92_002538 [Lobulomyces angularis]|nr:hypothetical protein HDU92_002538 [Lobulomyces angularis]
MVKLLENGGCFCKHNLLQSKSIFSGNFCGDGKAHYAPNIIIQPIHMELHLDFSEIKNCTVKGKNFITFTHEISTNFFLPQQKDLTTVYLDAISFNDLTVKGEGTRYYYDGRKLTICWDSPFEVNENRKVEIDYTVIHPIAGIYFNIPNEQYPMRVMHCITDHEPERCRYWIPLVDSPTVRTTLEFLITAPTDLMAIANGRQTMKKKIDNDLSLTKWVLDTDRCPSYLICVAIGDFLYVEDNDPELNIPISYLGPKGKFSKLDFSILFTGKQKAEDLKRTFGKTASMIKWIQKKLDYPFPWKKYYQIVSPQVRGAMENISFVAWNDFYCIDETLSKEKQLLVDQTNVHEISHTYFGNLLVVRHFDHTWLKESWATYMEAVWIEEHLDADHFRYEMLDCKHLYVQEAARYVRPLVKRVWESPWEMFDSHAYPGGGLRLHMLRMLLGEHAFWAGVRNYVKTFAGKVVETEDFRKCLERSSGLNLVKFFDQWIFGKGYPKLKLKFDYNFEKNIVQIKLEQTQSSKDTGVVKIFEINFEIEVEDINGYVYSLNLEFSDSTVSSAQVALMDTSTAIKIIRLDPLGKLIFDVETEGSVPEVVLINTCKSAKDICNRIWAYEELINMGTTNGMRKVQENILIEPFWGVRVQVANALSKAKTHLCVLTLAAMLENEKDFRAMYGLASACNIRDPIIHNALRKFLNNDNNPYRATAAALENLGKQNCPADLEYLINFANDDTKIGQHGILRSGVFEGLANHSSKGSYVYLEQQTRVSLFPALRKESEKCLKFQPEKTLPALISGLATAALKQVCNASQNHVISLLTDLLRDHRHFVKKEAILALCEFGNVESIPAILGTKPTFADQDWMFIRRMLSSLKENRGESKIKDLVRNLEDVEGRLRKMEWNWTDDKDSKQRDEEEAENVKKETDLGGSIRNINNNTRERIYECTKG